MSKDTSETGWVNAHNHDMAEVADRVAQVRPCSGCRLGDSKRFQWPCNHCTPQERANWEPKEQFSKH